MIKMEEAAGDDLAAAVSASNYIPKYADKLTELAANPLSDVQATEKMVDIYRENFARDLPTTERNLLAANINQDQINRLHPKAAALAESLVNMA